MVVVISELALAAPGEPEDSANILLVDDRPENLLALTELLQHPYYNLVKAGSGEEALRFLLKMEFAVILLDVQMPGMDGFETAELIRKRQQSKHTPIIFITAASKSTEYIGKGYSLGAVDYMLKPIVPDILKTKVAVFVELYTKRMTETKAKEQMVQLAEKLARSNEELLQFAYVASHDLQEPLRKIKSFTELLALRYKGKLDPKADEYIHYITDGAERMQNLIIGLLNFSRVTTQGRSMERVDLNRLIKEIIQSIQLRIEETGTVLKIDNLPTLKVDRVQIGQVFQNLVLNAIKFKGEKTPVIQISAQKTKHSSTAIWQFSVRDNGIGIEPEQNERVFQIFQRLHARGQYPGEGMGLAICRKIIERHEGRIWLESEGPGEGTTFHFTLPDSDSGDG